MTDSCGVPYGSRTAVVTPLVIKHGKQNDKSLPVSKNMTKVDFIRTFLGSDSPNQRAFVDVCFVDEKRGILSWNRILSWLHEMEAMWQNGA